ncbi:asparaginase [Actinosynnema sp. NPDC020468]|uniref:asparaginase n=1 Tax=Actinosynnema sp. NPDC020468 TaxID=3154488 RepID=UPI0033E29874
MAHDVVAEVWRGDFLESVHHGSVVVLDPEGRVLRAAGQPDATCYPRSSNKPFQALALVRNGFTTSDELLALACASHSGEPFHVDGVARILAAAGLSFADLGCTPDLPLGEHARTALLAAGGGPEPRYMNCSGKHAAMLATAVRNGWSTHDYLDPSHPVQKAARDTLEDLSGERVAAEGVDGCGAPLHGISLTGLARAFGRLAVAEPGTSEHRVAHAMRSYPEWVGGEGRDVTTLMRGVTGSVAKDGAEGVYAIGLPDGSAAACKIADGSTRARAVVLLAALRELGVTGPAELAEFPVLGHGRKVGGVRPAAALTG